MQKHGTQSLWQCPGGYQLERGDHVIDRLLDPFRLSERPDKWSALFGFILHGRSFLVSIGRARRGSCVPLPNVVICGGYFLIPNKFDESVVSFDVSRFGVMIGGAFCQMF